MKGDEERLARASRDLRRRLGLRQTDLIGGGRSRRFVRSLENGEVGRLRIDDVTDHFAAMGASLRLTAWWNGAALDRLMDERHAELVERAVRVLRVGLWQTETEVTFSIFGERGSIDILAGHAATRALFVGEVKSEWGSLEETNRRLDIKMRHAPELAEERFGWRPALIARVLILPDNMTVRRVAEKHAATLDSAYPARGREVRAWIRRPSGHLRGLWFLSNVRPRRHRIAS